MEYKELELEVLGTKDYAKTSHIVAKELESRGIKYPCVRTKYKKFCKKGLELIKVFDIEYEGMTKYEKLDLLEKELVNRNLHWIKTSIITVAFVASIILIIILSIT